MGTRDTEFDGSHWQLAGETDNACNENESRLRAREWMGSSDGLENNLSIDSWTQLVLRCSWLKK